MRVRVVQPGEEKGCFCNSLTAPEGSLLERWKEAFHKGMQRQDKVKWLQTKKEQIQIRYQKEVFTVSVVRHRTCFPENWWISHLWKCNQRVLMSSPRHSIFYDSSLWDNKTADTSALLFVHTCTRDLTRITPVILTSHTTNKREWLLLLLHLCEGNGNILQNLLAARKSTRHYVPLFCLPNACKQLQKQPLLAVKHLTGEKAG